MADTNVQTTEKKHMTLGGLLSDQKIRARFEEILKDRAPGFISSILSVYRINSFKTLIPAPLFRPQWWRRHWIFQ